MITVYASTAEGLVRRQGDACREYLSQATWIDLNAPTLEEAQEVEAAVGLRVPSRETMQEIETSSRLRQDENAIYLTVTLLSNVATPHPKISATTFILSEHRLITVRFTDPLPFRVFNKSLESRPGLCATGETALLGLIDNIIDRLADVIEMCGQDVEALSQEVFNEAEKPAGRQHYDGVIARIGRTADVASKARDSIMSLMRALTYLGLAGGKFGSKDLRQRLKTQSRDLQSISDYAAFVSDKITFLLDATLGMLGNQQNSVMMVLSVIAMVFLPPTLIGSIYGMNFKDMPELDWRWGYPMAIILMILSAVAPYYYFKKKGWM